MAGDPREAGREHRVVQALKATLQSLLPPDSSVDLVGFSFGAYIAAELAAAFTQDVNGDSEHAGVMDRPQNGPTLPQGRHLVRSLALIGAAGHGGARRMRSDLRQWRSDDRPLMLEALRHNLAALMLHDPAAIDELALEIHEASCLRTRFHSKSISRAGGLPAALRRFKGPTLLMWGEHDVTAQPEQIGPELVGREPHRQWRVVTGAGHWACFERADEVNRRLQQWLDRAEQNSTESGPSAAGPTTSPCCP